MLLFFIEGKNWRLHIYILWSCKLQLIRINSFPKQGASSECSDSQPWKIQRTAVNEAQVTGKLRNCAINKFYFWPSIPMANQRTNSSFALVLVKFLLAWEPHYHRMRGNASSFLSSFKETTLNAHVHIPKTRRRGETIDKNYDTMQPNKKR